MAPQRDAPAGAGSHDEDIARLEAWLADGYDQSFRTACMIVGNRADAEEAVQEAYLRAWRFRDSLPAGVDVRRWLYRVVVNACYTKLRSEIPHRDRRGSDDALGSLGVSDRSAPIEAATDLGAALGDLPVQLRTVVVLRYFADLSEREIATAISRPVGTVKSRLHEARRLLAGHPALRAPRNDDHHPTEAQR